MKISVRFFAQVCEITGKQQLELEGNWQTVDQLRISLMSYGERWQLALEERRVLVAVNQTLSMLTQLLYDGDEVAFFPPVTGVAEWRVE